MSDYYVLRVQCLAARWKGSHVPVVEFRNGRKQLMYPELFSADVANVGTCSRIQVPYNLYVNAIRSYALLATL